MKKITTFLIFVVIGFTNLLAQSPAKYWVQFTDKNNSPYRIDHPEEFLSPRAIENRKSYKIEVDETDLPVNPQYIAAVTALDTGMMLFTRSKWLNGITIYSQVDSIETMIERLPFVNSCEKTITMKKPENKYDTLFYFKPSGQPKTITPTVNDELDYGKGNTQIRINNVHWLHRMGFKGEGMVMMVMDGGFQNADTILHFKKAMEENRILGGRNFVLPGNSIFRKESHGTMVFSCIASDISGELVGSAPHVMTYFAKTEDGRSENVIEEDNWVAGIEWADSLGCKVLNSSLGYTKFDDTLRKRVFRDLNGETSRASMAATMAASKGMIVCNSAGNEGRGKWKHIGSPADAKDILTVGAVNDLRIKAPFSSFGPTADGRIKPDAVSVGEGTWVANPFGKTVRANGTSFSSPLLSGMVVCLWQAFPHKTNYEIMDAIRKSGSQSNRPDDALGYGITDFMEAYNILNQSDTLKSVRIAFSAYAITTGTPLKVGIESKNSKTITITTTIRGTELTTVLIDKMGGVGYFDINLPKLPKKQRYGLLDIQLKGDDFETTYVIGIEHPGKKSKKEKTSSKVK